MDCGASVREFDTGFEAAAIKQVPRAVGHVCSKSKDGLVQLLP